MKKKMLWGSTIRFDAKPQNIREFFFIISRLLMYRNVLALRFAILSLLSRYSIMWPFEYKMYPTHARGGLKDHCQHRAHQIVNLIILPATLTVTSRKHLDLKHIQPEILKAQIYLGFNHLGMGCCFILNKIQ